MSKKSLTQLLLKSKEHTDPLDFAKKLSEGLERCAEEFTRSCSGNKELNEYEAQVCKEGAEMLYTLGIEVYRLREAIGCHHYGRLDRSDLWHIAHSWNGDKRKESTFIGIDYDETSLKYNAVEVTHGETIKRFETGDPVADWAAAMGYLPQCPEPHMNRSSVDNFVMDVEGFKFDKNSMIVRSQGMIVVTYSSIDGVRDRRKYKTPKAPRLFAHRMVGEHPEIGTSYAVSGDGVGKITVVGMTLAELFSNERET